jgi:hypothetical protein
MVLASLLAVLWQRAAWRILGRPKAGGFWHAIGVALSEAEAAGSVAAERDADVVFYRLAAGQSWLTRL